jgi:CRP-like cAMP-binding protein
MVSIEIVRRTDLFASLADDDLHVLAACFQVRQHARGDFVYRQGDPGDTMLVIATGRLVAFTDAVDGTSTSLNEMGPGELLGEMSFLDPAPRSATVRAAADSVTYELSHDTMTVLSRRAPKAASALVTAGIRGMTRRLRTLDERIEAELNRLSAATIDDATEQR